LLDEKPKDKKIGFKLGAKRDKTVETLARFVNPDKRDGDSILSALNERRPS